MKIKKILILATCFIFSATFAGAQSIKDDMQRQKQEQQQREQSIKAEAERQKRLQAEREEAARRAEQERQKREERKRLGIPDITKDDLTRNAVYLFGSGSEYTLRSSKEYFVPEEIIGITQSKFRMHDILTLNVYSYYNLIYNRDTYKEPYNTELKRKNFEQSDDYAEKLAALKALRDKTLKTVFCAKGTVESNLYDNAGKYDLKRKAFLIGTRAWNDYNHVVDKQLVKGFSFNSLPVETDINDRQFFVMPIDETTAVEIEGNNDIIPYVFFMINGKMKGEQRDEKSFFVDKVRIVLAHQKTGKIYYDRSFPEGCLPLAKQETLSTEDYLVYQAEQQRLAAEKKAEESRAEMERIQEERRKEQEKKDAKIAQLGLEMVFVRGGTFTMGATPEQGNEAHNSEKPAHIVTLSDYYIGKYEVTTKQWNIIMNGNLSNNLPITYVSWNRVQEFIRKLNAQTGKNYRLPTEAEWEYAARGGQKSKGYKYAGSDVVDNVAWVKENSNTDHPVGGKQPNELGIYDMSGNAKEMCNDYYGAYSAEAQTNPKGAASGAYRIARGGSYGNTAEHARIARRVGNDGMGIEPDKGWSNIGFRLAMSVDANDTFVPQETEAVFPGGTKALSEYLSTNLNYPEAAKKQNVHGKVEVRFWIEKDGSIGDVEIIKSLSAECDAEVIRVIKAMPRWTPAMVNGKAVKIFYNLPVSF